MRLAVVGAGLIGQRHARIIAGRDGVELAAIADLDESAKALASALGTAWHPTFDAAMTASAGQIDGVIIATPNTLHAAQAITCIENGLPVLIEKPIADTVAAGQWIADAAEAAGTPVLVGHHRRHNPIVKHAKAEIDSGAMGRIVAAHGFFWLYKPDNYFDAVWRRQPGAGPVLINLIHDIDLLRHLVGDIATVQAMTSHASRAFEVEDTAAVMLRFASGALGTISASDTVVAPWSYELTAGENPAYPKTDEGCYFIGGSHGSLSLPRLETWRHDGVRSWWSPIEPARADIALADPLELQIDHFADVIRGRAQPLVTARDGLRALEVCEAIHASAAADGTAISIPHQADC